MLLEGVVQLQTDEIDAQSLEDCSRFEGSALKDLFDVYLHAEDDCCVTQASADSVVIERDDHHSGLNRRDCMIMRAGQCLGKEDLLLMNLNRKRKFTARSLTRCRFLFLHHDHYMQFLGTRSSARILPQLSSIRRDGENQTSG
jgi:hypothetical protein